ncbi:hypothetical protein MAPG_09208 [Magnaporthiopsis poae ATCC 64411]|uniref:Uncharacterized protein n=1 Tax=Magnaporthiopsis poae (strain ATCC 64411 / 73-15) TaxID=644358 RepID=A0A0C4E9C8_MAGP6|nr:hypothetical protein MAPG_09208 [Magnaporthiopsis poae ATCC 64411]
MINVDVHAVEGQQRRKNVKGRRRRGEREAAHGMFCGCGPGPPSRAPVTATHVSAHGRSRQATAAARRVSFSFSEETDSSAGAGERGHGSRPEPPRGREHRVAGGPNRCEGVGEVCGWEWTYNKGRHVVTASREAP